MSYRYYDQEVYSGSRSLPVAKSDSKFGDMCVQLSMYSEYVNIDDVICSHRSGHE